MKKIGEFKRKNRICTKYLAWCEYKKNTVIIKLLTQEWICTSERSSNGMWSSLTLDVCFQHSEDGRHNNTVISSLSDLLDLSAVWYCELASFGNLVYVTVCRWKGGQELNVYVTDGWCQKKFVILKPPIYKAPKWWFWKWIVEITTG